MEKCMHCGETLAQVSRIDLPYRSLPGVVLVGIEARSCLVCSEVEYAIPRIEALNESISRLLVGKPTRLAGTEVRFLRKYLGWSGRDFASRVGVTPETVSRWENGVLAIGETPDKLLRMFVLHEKPVADYSLDQFDVLAKAEGDPIHLRLSAEKDWTPVAA